MRFAITATDRYLGVFQALVAHSWTPVKVYTTPVDHRIHQNAALIQYARQLNLEVQISRLSEHNLRQLCDQGCDALVVASYQWRIPDWRPYLKYAVNFHPSPLPRGRGPYPLPAAILGQAASWGVSCHKLEREFDSGDVLKVDEFSLSPDEEHDGLDLKIQLAARRLSGEVAGRFEEYWNHATPQNGSSYHAMWTDEERRLEFSHTVEQILRRVRAFGPFECLALVNNTRLHVRRAVGWTESHQVPAGTVVHANNLAMVVAAADGFVGLTEWNLFDASAVTGTARR
jgi:methionyl-tRNA formyltransferase